MAAGSAGARFKLVTCAIVLLPFLVTIATSADIFLDWHVSTDINLKPVSTDQPVITINGLFPGPLINATTNDVVHVNVFNDLDDPLLFTWNGIQQRLDSWEDGVSGTDCPIQPGRNWTYEFQTKDQIGTFSYFPSINFLKAGGGFGPIRVNNRPVISVPFPKPEAEFDLLIGDWYSSSYKGTFNVRNVTIAETFIFQASTAVIDGLSRYTVNNVSYLTPNTPLKLADYFSNGTGVYELDAYSKNTSNANAVRGVFVASALYKGWTEIVLKNNLDIIDTWHLDGYSFFVVGIGEGEWNPESRSSYNLYDPVARSTVPVYPGGWSAVYVYPDNPGIWNLRSQNLESWYLGEELYVRVYDADPNPAKEKPPPQNLLLCGLFQPSPPSLKAHNPNAPSVSPAPNAPSVSPAPNAPSVSPAPNAPASKAYNPHRTRSSIEYSWWLSLMNQEDHMDSEEKLRVVNDE
ncbi:hypothetical protein JHK82_028672 [Glycine max]|nr:hypothetical protein JHK82_028672 [Glycine max]